MNSRRAFTLFEVLIAITIVVILVSTLSATLGTAFQLKQKSEDTVSAFRDTQVVGDVFVRDLASVVPPNPLSSADSSTPGTLGGMNNSMANGSTSLGGINGMNSNGGINGGAGYLFGPFIGDNASITCYVTGSEPKAAIQGDARYIEYRLVQQADGRRALMRSVETNLLADQINTSLPQELLVTGVTDLTFTYFDGTSWQSSWDSTSNGNVLPYAVKMILTLTPVPEGAQPRVITRVATIWCAQKTVDDANAAINAQDNVDTTTTTGN